ncbi:MAG: moderate conductance mechanosensitive channel [Actinomycetota bacterium]|jgi:small conductance mechanosensitive channel|nr:moderate conductance mechanosensitive channel [Actinomycetota bacterium]MDQ1383504.1 moderate conductance mechanosensitive channel [Actinomycetota bacterium]
MTVAITSLSDFSRWARSNGLEIILLIVGSLLLARFAAWFGARLTDRIDLQDQSDDALVRSEAAKHRHSLTQVITWTVVVLIYSITGVLVLERFGVPLSTLIAPATVAGVALGFGAQRIVQDILAGFFMITERQYGFGDLIRISSLGSTTGVTGTVEDVTLRTTRMRTVNGEVVIIPNGQINQVTNLSRDWARAVIDVPLPATADITRVNAILQTVGEELYADENFSPLLLDTPTVMGVESIDVDRFSIRMVCRTLPGKQFDVGRALRARIATALRHEGINLALDVETTSAAPDAH